MRRATRNLRRSIAWAAFESAVTLATALVTALWVGRIIGPGAFGTAAVAILVGSLAEVFVSCAFVEPLIQRRGFERRTVDVAFTAMLLTSIAVYAILIALSWQLARAFASPALIPLIAVQGLTCLLLAVRGAPEAVLARKLRFRALSIRNIAAKIVASVVALAVAGAGGGAWSLVLGNLAFAIVATIAILTSTSLRLRIVIDLAESGALLRLGVFNLLDAVLWTATPRLFGILTGQLHGVRVLGQVNIAFRINDTASALLAAVSARLALPVFSRVAHQSEVLEATFLRGTRLVFLVAAPVFLGVAFTGREIVGIALGPDWPLAPAALTAVSIFSLCNFARVLAQPAVKAAGRPALLVVPHLVGLAFIAAGSYATAAYGVEAQLRVWEAFGLVYMALSIDMLRRAIGLGWATQLAPLGHAFLPLLGMCSALWGTSRWLDALPLVEALLLKIVIGAVAYLGLLSIFERESLRRLLGSRVTGRRGSAAALID